MRQDGFKYNEACDGIKEVFRGTLLTQVLPEDYQNLIINVSIVVDEKVNNLDHEYLLLVEGSR